MWVGQKKQDDKTSAGRRGMREAFIELKMLHKGCVLKV